MPGTRPQPEASTPGERQALPSPARVLVVGTSAVGKSTFARQLAAACALPCVPLDPLYWGPDWTPKPRDEFVRLIEQATAGDRWVVDGNYGSVRDLLWPRANVVIWLNYRMPLVLWRGLRRTLDRALSRQELWHGNRESFRRAFLSRQSILVWILTTHPRRTRELRALQASQTYPVQWVEFNHPSQAQQWLDALLP